MRVVSEDAMRGIEALCRGPRERLWRRRLQHCGQVGDGRTWQMSLRELVRLGKHIGGLDKVVLRDCELLLDMAFPETLPTEVRDWICMDGHA